MDAKVPADAVRAFNRILHLLTSDLDGLTRPALVEVGSALYLMERHAHKALDVIKTRLREHPDVDPTNRGTFHFEGTSRGKVAITVPGNTFTISKGADLDQLRAEIGDEAFQDCFDVIVRYKLRKGAESFLASTDSNTRQAVLAVLEQNEGTPRVSFQRK